MILTKKIYSLILKNYFKDLFDIRRFKHEFVLKDEVQEFFLDNTNKHRYHPGHRRSSIHKLPFRLEFAATSVINRNRNKNFRRTIDKVNNDFLRIFIDNNKHQETNPTNTSQKIKFDQMFDYEEYEEQKETIRLQETRYFQKEFYNNHECVGYMAARLPANYAALSYVFNEIRREEPEFTPKSVFDFGSGVGTTIWVSDEYWKDEIQEYFCVEMNENMNQLSRELLQKGTTNNDSILDRVFYRQFLTAKHIPSYDLVVSAFSLLEMKDTRSRLYVVENLWQKTNGLLVLVEHGSRAGFAAITEARNFLLRINKNQLLMTTISPINHQNSVEIFNDSQSITDKLTKINGSILAPCPHDLICPRQQQALLSKKKSYCNFQTPYQQLDYGQEHPGIKMERFTFLVMRKYNGQFGWSEAQKNWPKIIEPVKRKSKHAICRVCDNDGHLKEIIVSKSKTPRDLYRCIKCSKWGDKIPANIIEIQSKKRDEKTSN